MHYLLSPSPLPRFTYKTRCASFIPVFSFSFCTRFLTDFWLSLSSLLYCCLATGFNKKNTYDSGTFPHYQVRSQFIKVRSGMGKYVHGCVHDLYIPVPLLFFFFTSSAIWCRLMSASVYTGYWYTFSSSTCSAVHSFCCPFSCINPLRLPDSKNLEKKMKYRRNAVLQLIYIYL